MSAWMNLVSAGVDFLGGLFTNYSNAKQNKKNRELALHMFNEQMRKKYQYAVKDMKAAGLNPMLAATNGVSGASASVPSNIPMQAPTISSAIARMRESSAQTEAVESTSELNSANAEKVKADTALVKSTMGAKIEQSERELQKLKNESDYVVAKMDDLQSQGQKRYQEVVNLRKQEKILSHQIKAAQNKNTLFENEYARLELDNLLKQKNLDWFTVANSARVAKDFSSAAKNVGDLVGSFLPGGSKKQFFRMLRDLQSRGKANVYLRVKD